MRIARTCVTEADELEQLADASRALALVPAADLQPELDVLRGRHVREQRVRLEHHAHVALRRRDVRDVLAVDDDPAAVGSIEAGDEPQRRRLAAARRAEQREELALAELHLDPVERLDGAEVAVQVPELEVGHQRAAAICARAPRCRPTRSRASIAAQVMPKLMIVTAAAGYAFVSLMYCR